MNLAKMNAALSLATRGWHVFPCMPNTKRPIGSLVPNGFHDATTNRDVIMAWWKTAPDANIGIACEASGLYVVDLDVKADNVNGIITWKGLCDEHGEFPTFAVRTPSGGLHLYYKAPRDIGALANTQATVFGKGIDTRFNGYVLGEGSTIDGKAYVVESKAGIAPLPQWIAQAHGERDVERKTDTIFDGVPADGDEVEQRVAKLADELAQAMDGEGNASAARVAYMVGQYAGAGQIEPRRAFDLLMVAFAGWTWRKADDERVMQRTVVNQIKAGMRNPREWKTEIVADLSFNPNDDDFFGDDNDDEANGDAPEDGDLDADTDDADENKDNDEKARKAVSSGFFTDTRLADLFARALDGKFIYVFGIGWLNWTGTHWNETQEELVIEAVALQVKIRFAKCLDKAKNNPDYIDMANEWRKVLQRSKLCSVVALMRAKNTILVDVDRLDSNPDILNAQNGTVDLRTGLLAPHNPRDYCTKVANAEYHQDATHPAWDAALTAIPDDAVEFVQTYLGQSATGHMNAEDKFLTIVGGGENGKGTLLNDGVLWALGDYGVLLSERTLMANPNDHPTHMMTLRGARLALLDETPEARVLDTQRLKKTVGQPQITARRMRQDEVTFNATHTLLLATNYLPLVYETDHGTWRRLITLTFPYTFVKPGALITNDKQRPGDPSIKPTLREEPKARAAVLAWLVRGAMNWYANDRMQTEWPLSVTMDTEAWRSSMDVVGNWIRETFDVDPNSWVLADEVLTDYNEHTAQLGKRAIAWATLRDRLIKHHLLADADIRQQRIRPRTAGSFSRRPCWVGGGGNFPPEIPQDRQVQALLGLKFRSNTE